MIQVPVRMELFNLHRDRQTSRPNSACGLTGIVARQVYENGAGNEVDEMIGPWCEWVVHR